MWVFGLHSEEKFSENGTDLITEGQKGIILRELPNDIIILKNLVLELLGCNLSVTYRCKVSIFCVILWSQKL